jgi:hypothetical protein
MTLPCSFVSFRVVNLPQPTPGTPVRVCINLRPNGVCPTLGDFCYGYDSFGGCQYAIADQPQDCCPTSITRFPLAVPGKL